MHTLSLNLATFEYRTRRIAALLLFVTSLAAVSISFYTVRRGIELADEIREYEKRIAQLESVHAKAAARSQEKSGKPMGQEAMRTIREQAAFVNQLIASDVFPWDHLLDGIERALPEGVLLSSLRPSSDRKKITLTGRSPSTELLSRFMGGLESSDMIERAALTKLHVERESGHSGSMAFEIEGRLRPGTGF
jgi:Tfp pilus assembly protein PilN